MKVFFFCLAALCLLFLNIQPEHPSLWFQSFWNSGHVVLFFIAGLWLYSSLFKRFRLTFPLPFVIILQLAIPFWGFFALAFAIEYLQAQVGRQFSYGDVWLDMTGLLGGVAWAVGRGLGRRRAASLSYSVAVLILLVGFSPLLSASFDRLRMHLALPVLLSNVDALMLKRLEGNAVHHIVSKTQFLSETRFFSMALPETLLKVGFTQDRYSTLSVHTVYGDWSAYQTLVMDWYNPGDENLNMVCRVHDYLHYRSGQQGNDRFRKGVHLLAGWNQLRFPISDIVSAPKTRQMDITRIDQLKCYTMSLVEPREAYLSRIFLEQ
jgi:hypothetical protein